MQSSEKKSRRMSGLALRAAARIAETPGPGRLLYRLAVRDLGLAALQEMSIPPEVVPWRPLHLGEVTKAGEGGRDV
jgi:hypothetical protein